MFLQPCPCNGSGLRRQVAFGVLVGYVLQDGCTFTEDFTGRQFERRDITLRIDRRVVATGLGAPGFSINFLDVERLTCFVQDNMRGKRTGAGFVIELLGGRSFLVASRLGFRDGYLQS